MVDKKLEQNIKKTKEFIELWDKFYRIYKRTVGDTHVGTSKEREFLSTRELVNSRYEDLMDSLEIKPLKRFLLGSSVYNVLSVDKLWIISDKKLKVIGADWEESFRFLGRLLKRLERKRKKIEGFNKFFLVVKKGIKRVDRKRGNA